MPTRHLARTLAVVAALVLVVAACQPHTTRPPGEGQIRYRDPIFSAVTKRSNLTYGSAVTQTGVTQALTLDLYEPTGDTVTERPAIVWVHGGGFTGGNKGSSKLVELSDEFAKRGYVNVSINYRLAPEGCFPATSSCLQGIVDAQHDAQAAVRYLRANAASLRVDPDRIAIGGSSAGAITALNVAYGSDNVGTSGSPGQSSKVRAAVSIAGAHLLTGIETGEPPVLLFHGDKDTTVPYAWSTQTLDDAQAAGTRAYRTTFPNVGHGIYNRHSSTILTQTRNFLYAELDAQNAAR